MIYGIGVDLAQISRIESAYDRFGRRFAERILGQTELRDFEHTKRPARFLAMRFAAKEAASKAFGTGFKQGVAPRQIEVKHNLAGKPSLVFSGQAKKLTEENKITGSYVSLTDESDFAVAYVILEI
ncbi:MAG: holo-ACP synthase [Gammaproteobacteria bacterium]